MVMPTVRAVTDSDFKIAVYSDHRVAVGSYTNLDSFRVSWIDQNLPDGGKVPILNFHPKAVGGCAAFMWRTGFQTMRFTLFSTYYGPQSQK
ncbi:MAG: hypothetical protein BVN35_18320 [Proteobacteria bacterium ST_bin11]|nr:MAG: hypothetical protein BVN35_18320 [Proteobacteria bacterium ST_bin11]